MNILYVSPKYPTKSDPFTAFVATFCEEAARQGHKITVLAPCSVSSYYRHGIPIPPRHEKFDIGSGIEVFRPRTITLGEGSQLRRRISALIQRLTILLFLRLHKLDIDVVYGKFFLHALLAAPYARRRHLPLFVDCGEDIIKPSKYIPPRILSKAVQSISGVIAVSWKNKEDAIKQGLSTKTTHVFVNGYNPQFFYSMDKAKIRQELGLPKDAFIVIFCGRFNHRKGCARVEAAVKSLHDPDIKTIYIGRPVENQTWIPSGEECLFCNTLQHDEMARYLNAADVYVFPTLMEGCPNTTIEAMACGLPVISSDLSFNYDILDKENAILLDPMDIDAIAKSIALLKADPERRQRMSASSLNKASKLTIEHRVSGIMRFISESITPTNQQKTRDTK